MNKLLLDQRIAEAQEARLIKLKTKYQSEQRKKDDAQSICWLLCMTIIVASAAALWFGIFYIGGLNF